MIAAVEMEAVIAESVIAAAARGLAAAPDLLLRDDSLEYNSAEYRLESLRPARPEQ